MRNGSQRSRSYDLKRQIRRLNEIGIALSSKQNLNDLLEDIVREARHFTQADGGSLYIKEGDRLNFTVAQTESLQNHTVENKPFESFYLPLTENSIAGYVAITGELLNIPDVYELPKRTKYQFNKQYDVKNKYRSKSMLVVPMRDPSGSVIGVLQLINSLNGDGIVAFKDDYENLVLSLASQAAVAIQNVKLIEEIKGLFKSLVQYSAKAIDARSPHTAGHSGRVAKYAVRIANAINEENEGRLGNIYFTQTEIEELRIAGWLHDIGKIGVRESVLEKANKLSDDRVEIIRQRFETIKQGIVLQDLQDQLKGKINGAVNKISKIGLQSQLKEIDVAYRRILRLNIPNPFSETDAQFLKDLASKTYLDINGYEQAFITPSEYENLSISKGNLTAAEYKEIQAHVLHSFEILNKIPFTKDLKDIPKHAVAHHEYLDGSGYPHGLKGDEISLQARILCISDIYDALSSPDRPYKKATPIKEALFILKNEADRGKLDPDFVRIFIKRKLHAVRYDDDDDE